MKRLANYGNSLIKMTFEEKFQEQLKSHKNRILLLRYHLERLRTLTYMVCRREKIKQNWLNTQREILQKTSNLVDNPDLSIKSDGGQSLSMEHQKLFSKIITHHSIYPEKSDSNVLDRNSTEKMPVAQHAINNNPETEATTSAITKRRSSENSITNSLLRQLKRLKRSPISKQNPYARVYLNPTKSRKSTLSNCNSQEEETTEGSSIDKYHEILVNSDKSDFEDDKVVKKQLSKNNLSNNTTITPLLKCSYENGKKLMNTQLQKPIVCLSINGDENENIDSNEKINNSNGDIDHHHFSPTSKISNCRMIIRTGTDDRLPLSQNGNNNNNNNHHQYKKLRHHDHPDSTDTSSLSRKYPLRNKVK